MPRLSLCLAKDKTGVISVKCTKLGPEKTNVQVTYKYMALSESGEAFISAFNEAPYGEFIGEWQQLLSKYFDSMF